MSYAIYPSLAGKRVVVTGGGSGIGAAIVEAFAKQGARVFFIDVAEADSRQLEQTLASEQHAPKFLRCDLRDAGAIITSMPDGSAPDASPDALPDGYVTRTSRRRTTFGVGLTVGIVPLSM